MLTESDKSLIKQMIHAGRFHTVHGLLAEHNKQQAQEIIKAMGTKWCLHPSNRVKRLEIPLKD